MDRAVFEMIAYKRKMFLMLNYFSLVSLGGITFPLISSSNDFLFTFLMLIVYFYIGFIFCGLYQKRPLIVFLSTFALNLIGLSWRVLLEWGEFSMTRDLTALNVGIHLLFIPLYMTLIYLIVQRFK